MTSLWLNYVLRKWHGVRHCVEFGDELSEPCAWRAAAARQRPSLRRGEAKQACIARHFCLALLGERNSRWQAGSELFSSCMVRRCVISDWFRSQRQNRHVEIIWIRSNGSGQTIRAAALRAARSAPERCANRDTLLRRLSFGFAHGARRMAQHCLSGGARA